MLFFSKQGSQGELTLTRVDSLPASAKLQEAGKEIVVGHSESGHHHVAKCVSRMEYYLTENPNICYLKVDGDFAVEHLKQGPNQHEGIKADSRGPSIWQIDKQKQLNAEGLWETVRD